MNLSEVYTSVQGEGPNTGKPTTFVRFGGCNLRCQGWGEGTLPDGTVVRGCDTVFAVYPEWKGTWNSIESEELLSRVPDSPRRVCITGGEPLIQRSKELAIFVESLLDRGYEIDLFTNGSRPLSRHPWVQNSEVTVTMDWKLPGSEEGTTFDPTNLAWVGEKDAIKFVCKNVFDFDSALGHIKWAEESQYGLQAQVWFGPVWGEMDPAQLAELVESNYPEGRLNIQTHKYIWDPEARKV